jgi:hypothetical protein
MDVGLASDLSGAYLPAIVPYIHTHRLVMITCAFVEARVWNWLFSLIFLLVRILFSLFTLMTGPYFVAGVLSLVARIIISRPYASNELVTHI